MKLVLTSSSGRKIKELPIKATNFDEITSSPEALAEHLYEYHNCTRCPVAGKCGSVSGCYNALLTWLKQESNRK